ncbi:UDP-N-acetylmuramoyl-L-alanine--D-glutamate ligase [Hwanghaeella sp.]|uniref:UDP-N-acetylmuramoyl-L-alanine--D-glutamate ligase n=1 Tax=Hwanghaeella sp. TaxID=2605943 RepID=UPI003CCC3732
MSVVVTMYKDNTVAVVGLGKSGLSAARALTQGGADVLVWDDRPAARDDAQKAGYRLGAPDAYDWSGNAPAALVLSPGIPLTHPTPHPAATAASSHGIPILGDVELLYRACPRARYIGITGTNGKSTTTALIGHILSRTKDHVEIGGNLGTPALDLAPLEADGTYVLEMSSYQLDLTHSVAFDSAILLNVTADHLDRHGGMAGYIAAKKRIFRNRPVDAAAIVGVDDAHCEAVADALEADGHKVIRLSVMHPVDGGVYVADGKLIDAMSDEPTPVLDLKDAPSLPGLHNAQNIAAAYAAARREGLTPEEIRAGILSFPGLAHRLETVAVEDGIRFVNDSKATNAEATARALASFERIYWIAGGREKEGGYDVLRPYLPAVRKVFLIGEAAENMAAALSKSLEVEICGTLDRAVEQATALAMAEGVRGSAVLLSPACASFDQFPNFEVRGTAFSEAVAATLRLRKERRS